MRNGLLLFFFLTIGYVTASSAYGCNANCYTAPVQAVMGFDRSRYIVDENAENNNSVTIVPKKTMQQLKTELPSKPMVFDSKETIELNKVKKKLTELTQQVQTLSSKIRSIGHNVNTLSVNSKMDQHAVLTEQVNEIAASLEELKLLSNNTTPNEVNATVITDLKQADKTLSKEVESLKKTLNSQNQVETIINENGISENFYVLIFVIAGLSGMLFGGISAYLVFHFGFRKKHRENEI